MLEAVIPFMECIDKTRKDKTRQGKKIVLISLREMKIETLSCSNEVQRNRFWCSSCLRTQGSVRVVFLGEHAVFHRSPEKQSSVLSVFIGPG